MTPAITDVTPRASIGPGFVLGVEPLSDIDPATAFALLDLFYERGGRHIDTARDYGNSERHVADWMAAHGIESSIRLISKGGHPDSQWRPRLSRQSIFDDARLTDVILGPAQVDCYLLHRDDEHRSTMELATTLSILVEDGFCRRVGVSNWSFDRVDELVADLKMIQGPPLAVVSNYLGLAVPSGAPPFPGVRSVARSHLLGARAHGYTLLAWGSLSGGYFEGRRDGLAASFSGGANEIRQRAMLRTCKKYRTTPTQLIVRWLSTAHLAVVPVVGTRQVSHLREMLDAGRNSALDDPLEDLVGSIGAASSRRLLVSERSSW